MLSILTWLAGLLPGQDVNTASANAHEVYPVHFIDQAAIVRSSVISYVFRFEQVLDANALHAALLGLLKVGDWRKLGGRLRLNIRGELEIHVPRVPDPDRPAVRFSHVKLALGISEHRLGRRLPQKTGEIPSLHEGCHEFRPFFLPATLPNNIGHYLTTDEPLLCLHITSFSNATLVSLVFPHSVSDAMGTASLLRSWSQVLAHRIDLVAPLAGAREDVLAEVGRGGGTEARNQFILERRLTKGFSLLMFITRYTLDLLVYRNVTSRHIFLPVGFVTHLRQQAEAELAKGQTTGRTERTKPFLSDGDLITAWGANMVIQSRSKTRSAIICNVFDIRNRLDGIFNPSSAYLQNLILPSTAVLSPRKECQSQGSLARISLAIRRAIVTQTADQQVRSLLRIARTSFASLGMMPLFAAADSMVIACTNWSKARFLAGVDFSPAVVPLATSDRPESATVRPGHPTIYWGTTLGTNDSPRDTFVIYGNDEAGDYWLNGYLRKETWALIEAEFKRYSHTN